MQETETLTARLRQKLASASPETGETLAEQIVTELVNRALAGDIRCIREILDRTEGKAAARHEVIIPSPNPLPAHFEGILSRIYGPQNRPEEVPDGMGDEGRTGLLLPQEAEGRPDRLRVCRGR